MRPPGLSVLDLVDDEALAPDDPTPPDVEDLHRRLQLVLGEADDIEVLGRVGHHLLALDGPPDGRQAVADAGRPLELEGGGGAAHLVRRGA